MVMLLLVKELAMFVTVLVVLLLSLLLKALVMIVELCGKCKNVLSEAVVKRRVCEGSAVRVCFQNA